MSLYFRCFRFVNILENEIVFWVVDKLHTCGEELIDILNWRFVTGVNRKRREKWLEHCAEGQRERKLCEEREGSDGERGIVDTDTPRRGGQTFVNQLVTVLYS
jgi:hypothetical protein